MGATVTEMTRTFYRRPFKLGQHLDRLFRSLRYVSFDIGMSQEKFTEQTLEVVEQNAQLLPPDGELGIIHFVTAGEVPLYAGSAAGSARTTPTVCIHTFPLPFELWSGKMQQGMHLVTPSIRHVPPQCYDPKMKYRSRMHYFLADQQARNVDPDAAALLLDLNGNVTETSGANFLLVDKGRICSPTLTNTLPGVSRDTVIELAAQLGIPFVEKDLQLFDVVNADEAFLASTPYCLMPVTKINKKSIGEGQPGPVFKRIIAAWSELVGLDVERQVLAGRPAIA